MSPSAERESVGRKQVLAASLGGSPWAERADALATLLANAAVDITGLEASVRGGEGEPPAGGRLMIERARPALTRAVLACLGRPPTAADEALLGWAEKHDQPTIVGWDVGRTPPIAKLYANASDASADLRRELGALLGDAARELAPHVAGVNLGPAEQRELKVYEQSTDPPAGTPAALRTWAADAPVAGWVRSSDLGPAGPTPRAFFAALLPTPGAPELRTLPGWSEAHGAALPFPVGFAKSVGFDPAGRRWIAYVKPVGTRTAGHALEPVICLSGAGSEIGIHLEPLHAKAYVRTRDVSLSYRVREGAPAREAIHEAMAWAAACVRAAEREERAPRWEAPPAPWRITGA